MNTFFSYYWDESITSPERIEVIQDDGDIPNPTLIQNNFEQLVQKLANPHNGFPAREMTITDGNMTGIGPVPYTIKNRRFTKSNHLTTSRPVPLTFKGVTQQPTSVTA